MAVLLLFLLLLWATSASAQQLAFPTAEGWGRFSTGGRGGKAYNINSLSGGAGSGGSCNAGGCGGSAPFSTGTITFLDCWTDRLNVGARTCIFKVGGIIDVPFAYYNLKPNLTIAGQTAPGGGITIKNLLLTMCANGSCSTPMTNFIGRHFRIRPGVGAGAQGATGEYNAHEIIWDHMSFGWAAGDTTGSVVGSYNITYQWSLWNEGLNFSTAVPGEPGKAFLNQTCGATYTPDGAKGFALLHNFIANMWDRLPYLQCGNVQFVNNVLYNGKTWSLVDPPTHGTAIQTNFVNNYYQVGPQTDVAPATGDHMSILVGCCPGTGPQCNSATSCPFVQASGLYVSGNYHSFWRPTGTEADTALVTIPAGTSVPITSSPYPFPPIPSTTTSAQARTDVVQKAGAYAVADGTYATVRRDSVDQRAVDDITNNTGRMIAAESEVGGYPAVANGTPYTDTDGDGIADSWELAHSLDPTNAADGPSLAVNGYTNLENFLNELAGDTAPSTGPTLPPQLLLHWRLDEGTGTSAADATGHGWTGTLTGTPTWQSGRAPGTPAGALLMNGSTSYVHNDTFSWPANQPITVAVWVKTAGGTEAGAFNIGGSAQRAAAHIPYSDNVLYWDYGASLTTGRLTTNFAPYVGQWAHVVLTADAVNARAIWVNGVRKASASTADAPTAQLTGIELGRYAVTGLSPAYQSGVLDDFRLFTYALSPEEIQTLYRQTAGRVRHTVQGH